MSLCRSLVVIAAAAAFAFGVGANGRVGETFARPAPVQSATQVKIFTPWLPNGMLNPAITVRTTEMFMSNPNLPGDCLSAAITTQRPDAWRCETADPCFSPFPYSATEVACASAPWSNEVVLLMLSRPLPGPELCNAMPHYCPPQALNLGSPPWALELVNGAQCTKLTGTISSLGGLALVYGCTDGGSVGIASQMSPFDISQPLWRAFYLPQQGTAFEQAAVLTAWY